MASEWFQVAFARAAAERADQLLDKLLIDMPGSVLEKNPLYEDIYLPLSAQTQTHVDCNMCLEHLMHTSRTHIPLSHIGPRTWAIFETEEDGRFSATVVTLLDESRQPYGYLVTPLTPEKLQSQINGAVARHRTPIEREAVEQMGRMLSLTKQRTR